MYFTCLNIEFDYCSHCLLDLWSLKHHSITSVNFRLCSMLLEILSLIWTLHSSLLSYDLSQINFRGSRFQYLKSSTQVIGWHSTWAEADIWTTPELLHFQSSSAVHSLLTLINIASRAHLRSKTLSTLVQISTSLHWIPCNCALHGPHL